MKKNKKKMKKLDENQRENSTGINKNLNINENP